ACWCLRHPSPENMSCGHHHNGWLRSVNKSTDDLSGHVSGRGRSHRKRVECPSFHLAVCPFASVRGYQGRLEHRSIAICRRSIQPKNLRQKRIDTHILER